MVRQLAVARLRYFGRVVRGGPDFLCGLLQGVGGDTWRTLVLADLTKLREALAPKLDELGEPTEQAERWTALLAAHLRTWKTHLS